MTRSPSISFGQPLTGGKIEWRRPVFWIGGALCLIVGVMATQAGSAAAPIVIVAAIAIGAQAGLGWWWAARRAAKPKAVEAAEETGPPEPPDTEPEEYCHGCIAYSADSLHEAQLVLDLLDEAGIAARLFNRYLIGAMGQLPFTECWPKIWLVNQSDLEAARRVFQTYEARKRQTSDGTRHCEACGEDSPDNFELCWSCRTPFDEE